MKKIRNYSFWVSLTSAIVILIQAIGKICGFEVENTIVENLIMAICGVLVVLGVVVMPNNPEKEDLQQNTEKKIDNEDEGTYK